MMRNHTHIYNKTSFDYAAKFFLVTFSLTWLWIRKISDRKGERTSNKTTQRQDCLLTCFWDLDWLYIIHV